jgi:hypothetical protein
MLKKLKTLEPEEPASAPKRQKNEAEDPIVAKLHKLKDMVQNGIITEYDYEDTKAALLKKFID